MSSGSCLFCDHVIRCIKEAQRKEEDGVSHSSCSSTIHTLSACLVPAQSSNLHGDAGFEILLLTCLSYSSHSKVDGSFIATFLETASVGLGWKAINQGKYISSSSISSFASFGLS